MAKKKTPAKAKAREPEPGPRRTVLTIKGTDEWRAWLEELADYRRTPVPAYAGDVEDFARFLDQPGAGAAVEVLIGLPHGQANAVALGYKADLMARGLAPATIGRRLAALRSLVKLARTLGRVAWT